MTPSTFIFTFTTAKFDDDNGSESDDELREGIMVSKFNERYGSSHSTQRIKTYNYMDNEHLTISIKDFIYVIC